MKNKFKDVFHTNLQFTVILKVIKKFLYYFKDDGLTSGLFLKNLDEKI